MSTRCSRACRFLVDFIGVDVGLDAAIIAEADEFKCREIVGGHDSAAGVAAAHADSADPGQMIGAGIGFGWINAAKGKLGNGYRSKPRAQPATSSWIRFCHLWAVDVSQH